MQEDLLSSGVQVHSGQHGETSSLQKNESGVVGAPVVPATLEAEMGGLLKPSRSSLCR